MSDTQPFIFDRPIGSSRPAPVFVGTAYVDGTGGLRWVAQTLLWSGSKWGVLRWSRRGYHQWQSEGLTRAQAQASLDRSAAKRGWRVATYRDRSLPCGGDAWTPPEWNPEVKPLCSFCGQHSGKCLGIDGWRLIGPVALEVLRERRQEGACT